MILSAILFALLLGAFVFLILPRTRGWQRAASVATFLILVGVVYGGSVELLSRPKPLRLEWRGTEEAKVLGASMREGEAIYLWLQTADAPEPRAYVLPWSTKTAQQLQDAMQKGQSTGRGVRMSKPFTPGLDDREPKFYAQPQEALPDKNYASGTGTLVYQPARN